MNLYRQYETYVLRAALTLIFAVPYQVIFSSSYLTFPTQANKSLEDRAPIGLELKTSLASAEQNRESKKASQDQADKTIQEKEKELNAKKEQRKQEIALEEEKELGEIPEHSQDSLSLTKEEVQDIRAFMKSRKKRQRHKQKRRDQEISSIEDKKKEKSDETKDLKKKQNYNKEVGGGLLGFGAVGSTTVGGLGLGHVGALAVMPIGASVSCIAVGAAAGTAGAALGLYGMKERNDIIKKIDELDKDIKKLDIKIDDLRKVNVNDSSTDSEADNLEEPGLQSADLLGETDEEKKNTD